MLTLAFWYRVGPGAIITGEIGCPDEEVGLTAVEIDCVVVVECSRTRIDITPMGC